MAGVQEVLQRCDPVLLEPEQSDCAEAPMMVVYLTESRRVQKVLWRQLFVLDSMLSMLEGLQSAQQLLTEPCPTPPEGGARARWKALKLESMSLAEDVETQLGCLLERVQQIHDRRNKLTQLLKQLHHKKQQREQLAGALTTAHNALRCCDRELRQLMAQAEAVQSQLINWERIREELQRLLSDTQDALHVRLLSLSQSELSLELRPCLSSDHLSNEREPLKLSINWSHDDRFTLQVSEGTVQLLEQCVCGRGAELSAALQEAVQSCRGQEQLLAEIHTLRSRFAIDWRPATRLLVYLKTALLVCELKVEEGYPGEGQAHLLSVRRDGQLLDTEGLQPAHPNPSLTQWLLFLSNSPLI